METNVLDVVMALVAPASAFLGVLAGVSLGRRRDDRKALLDASTETYFEALTAMHAYRDAVLEFEALTPIGEDPERDKQVTAALAKLNEPLSELHVLRAKMAVIGAPRVITAFEPVFNATNAFTTSLTNERTATGRYRGTSTLRLAAEINTAIDNYVDAVRASLHVDRLLKTK